MSPRPLAGLLVLLLTGCGAASTPTNVVHVLPRPPLREGDVYGVQREVVELVDGIRSRREWVTGLLWVGALRPDGLHEAALWLRRAATGPGTILPLALTPDGRVHLALPREPSGDEHALVSQLVQPVVIDARGHVALVLDGGGHLTSLGQSPVDALGEIRASANLELANAPFEATRVRGSIDVQLTSFTTPDDAIEHDTHVRLEPRDASEARRLDVYLEVWRIPPTPWLPLREGENAETFDVDDATRKVRRHLRAIRACYEGELSHDQTIHGRVAMAMTIGMDGRTTNVRVADDSTGNAPLGTCLTLVIERWRFDPAPTDGPVTYSFPFVFEPD